MRIGELAKATGVEVETIRYYEREKLLPSGSRESNGYRRYGQEHLERLAFIRHCRALDMPLAQIKTLLDFIDKPRSNCGDVNELVDRHLQVVRARIKSMRALERQLDLLRAQCSNPRSGKSCGIVHGLVSAAHGEACACHAPEGKHSDRSNA